ncbi:MAG: PIN domain-containing protein [Saprospirales bacterium]|nr:MAG: PIN domain-containing protein [Saprospirales bacterium]
MIHSVRFTCVLDTNVIYPIEIRDLIFWFAHYDLFTPRWSKHIFEEWENVMKRKGIPPEEIEKRKLKAQLAFPDALVENYEPLVESLTLPDEKDRHVLAAAIKANANVIVTNNIKESTPKTHFYSEWLQNPISSLSGKIFPQRSYGYACGIFSLLPRS